MTTEDQKQCVALEYEIVKTLGELRQQVGVLQAQCEHIIKSQEAADERRREIYTQLNKLGTMEVEVARIGKLVDEHEKKSQRTIGMIILSRLLWAFGGAAAAGGAWFTARH
jgi:hypothetical protein